MDAIETMMSEHRRIERVIDALVAFTGEIQRRRSTDREELARFVGFLRRYADQLHHGKEEDILFRAMADHGFPTQGGPIAVMLAEHVRGRALIRILAEAVDGEDSWSDEDRATIVGAAQAYGALLRSHIHKEDAILYPMAEQHLPAAAMVEVNRACVAFDESDPQAELHVEYESIADGLVARHAAALHGQEVHP